MVFGIKNENVDILYKMDIFYIVLLVNFRTLILFRKKEN